MGMTAEILKVRRKHLGASETPVVLGMSPFAGATPDRVYWDKCGPEVDRDAPHLRMGNDLEPALIGWAEREIGVSFETDPNICWGVLAAGIGTGILAATPDGIYARNSDRFGVEGKAVMRGNPDEDSWGDEGTDHVPYNVLIQVQQQMAVHRLEMVYVPVLWCIGFRPEFRMYTVPRDESLWGEIATPATKWWCEHVQTRIPPGDEPPPLHVLRAIQRRDGEMIDADDGQAFLVASWDEHRKARIEAEKVECDLLAKVLAELGDAEGMSLPDGRRFTYREQNGPRKCDLDALQARAPGIYDEIVTQPSHRTARLTGKAKQKKG